MKGQAMGEVADSILNQWNQMQEMQQGINFMPRWVKIGIYHINLDTGLVIYSKPDVVGMFMLSSKEDFVFNDMDSVDMRQILMKQVESGAIVKI